MELRSLFVIDYCERKSLQKRIQSPVPDIIPLLGELVLALDTVAV